MSIINVDGGYAWGHQTRNSILGPPDPCFWQFRGLWGECWLGPVTAPWGSSPYMDWYYEKFYYHLTARSQ